MIYLVLHLVPRKTFTVIQNNPLYIEANALASRLQSIRTKKIPSERQFANFCRMDAK